MTANNVIPLVARRDHRPTAAPVAVTADALIELCREDANLPDTGIDTILWAILPGLHTDARLALYAEINTWIGDHDHTGYGPEYDDLRQRAHDTIHALVAQAVGR